MTRLIDAHIHYADDDADFLQLLHDVDVHLVNICFVAGYDDDWRAQRALYSAMAEQEPDYFSWITTFDLPRFDDDSQTAWTDRVLASLEADFAQGAAGCKIWKNVGMSVRKADGSFLLIDDPIFEPIFEYLDEKDHTLLMHMAEPLACWQPLDERSPHYGYYSTHPQWHMYNHPEYPSHGELIDARDRVVERYPDLRIVGAHLGSLEYDVDEVAARLDRYPNFAVDTSARLGDMAMQDSHKVAEFFDAYQNRILFGTDIVMSMRPSAMPEEERRATLQELRASYAIHFAYFETEEPLQIKVITTTGLGLSQSILDKIYRTNALHWYPALHA